MTEVRHITFIRHGKTPSNERKAYIGITDEKLSTDGQELIKKRVYPLYRNCGDNIPRNGACDCSGSSRDRFWSF